MRACVHADLNITDSDSDRDTEVCYLGHVPAVRIQDAHSHAFWCLNPPVYRNICDVRMHTHSARARAHTYTHTLSFSLSRYQIFSFTYCGGVLRRGSGGRGTTATRGGEQSDSMLTIRTRGPQYKVVPRLISVTRIYLLISVCDAVCALPLESCSDGEFVKQLHHHTPCDCSGGVIPHKARWEVRVCGWPDRADRPASQGIFQSLRASMVFGRGPQHLFCNIAEIGLVIYTSREGLCHIVVRRWRIPRSNILASCDQKQATCSRPCAHRCESSPDSVPPPSHDSPGACATANVMVHLRRLYLFHG